MNSGILGAMRGYRIPALVVVGGLLLLAVISARGLTVIPTDPRDPERVEAPTTTRDLPTATETFRPPQEIPADSGAAETAAVLTLSVVVLLIVAGLALLVLRALPRRRPTPAPGGEPVSGEVVRTRLREAAELAHHHLTTRRADTPPDDAVIAAWLALEKAAEHEGAVRGPSQTSTEFTALLLATLTPDETALNHLRTLYQRARFSPTPTLTPDDVDAAGRALEQVLHDLRTAT